MDLQQIAGFIFAIILAVTRLMVLEELSYSESDILEATHMLIASEINIGVGTKGGC